MSLKSESLIDAKIYREIRHRFLRGPVPVGPGHSRPHLIRETEDGKATGRWMVLDRVPDEDPPRWAWPPVASNDNPNTCAWRFS